MKRSVQSAALFLVSELGLSDAVKALAYACAVEAQDRRERNRELDEAANWEKGSVLLMDVAKETRD